MTGPYHFHVCVSMVTFASSIQEAETYFRACLEDPVWRAQAPVEVFYEEDSP